MVCPAREAESFYYSSAAEKVLAKQGLGADGGVSSWSERRTFRLSSVFENVEE
jgi:hypothetical protein